MQQWRTTSIAARSFGAEHYLPEVLERSTRYYVQPNCTNIDPSAGAENPIEVGFSEALFARVDKFLFEETTHRHLLILADSGMGKSSFVINYYIRNQRRFRHKRQRLAVVPLGIPNADSDIGSIGNKRDTILFLDAFDEDTRAIADHRVRLTELMGLCRDFRRVLITCRTQFFPKDEEIPTTTGLVRVTPRGAGESGVYEFIRLYLSPFNNAQVSRFVKKRFPFWQWTKRRQAREMIGKVKPLSVRPMLLAYIPDFMEQGAEINYSFELYSALVEAWLEREKGWVDKESLRTFSERLAMDVYLRREERGTELVARAELESLAQQWDISLEGWKLTGRSLLNKDAEGRCKFAHRSIMEYLFVMQFVRGETQCAEVEWTDQMKTFLNEIINSGKWDVLHPGEPSDVYAARVHISPEKARDNPQGWLCHFELSVVMGYQPKALEWFECGLVLYEKQQYRRALAAFEQAIAVTPADVLYWLYKGMVLMKLGRSIDQLRGFPQHADFSVISAFPRSLPEEARHDGPSFLVALIADQRVLDTRSRIATGNALGMLGDPRLGTPPLYEPEMVKIPAGEFPRGTKSGRGSERPQRQIYLDTFEIAKYPLANCQYKAFLDANPDREAPKEWNGRDYPVGKANHPVVYISWEDAQAYGAWLSEATGKQYRLPTEAEWEKAARGTDGRAYPWGNEFDKDRCNTRESGVGGTTPVGSYPAGASPYGVLDMPGNVLEWCADWYQEDYYQHAPERNPPGPEKGDFRVVRGGSWINFHALARCACRYGIHPERRVDSVGVRFSRTS